MKIGSIVTDCNKFDKMLAFWQEALHYRKGKRQYLSEEKNRELLDRLDRYFETKVAIPRMRRGKKQEIETLIDEEAFLFAKYLKDERTSWHPRIAELS